MFPDTCMRFQTLVYVSRLLYAFPDTCVSRHFIAVFQRHGPGPKPGPGPSRAHPGSSRAQAQARPGPKQGPGRVRAQAGTGPKPGLGLSPSPSPGPQDPGPGPSRVQAKDWSYLDYVWYPISLSDLAKSETPGDSCMSTPAVHLCGLVCQVALLLIPWC